MSSIFEEKLIFPQDEGKDVTLLVSGDEFYARYETLDGFTVVYDRGRGLFCYAQLLGGELISSGVPLARKPPRGLRRHLRESAEVRNQRFERRFRLMNPDPPSILPFASDRTFGANNGLLRGRRVSSGQVRGLTVLVEFADVPCQVGREDVSAMLNDQGYAQHDNFCSVHDYFLTMSSGALVYDNEVFGPIKLPENRGHYANQPLFGQVMEALEEQGVDFSRYDSRKEGAIDAINFMYAGQTVYRDWLWPHNHTLDWTSRSGLRANFYQICSLGDDPAGMSIGTFCHENGHMLCRFPDLYDYGKRDGDFEQSSGLGIFCLMSAGNHLGQGKTPAPVSAYLRDLVGWCRPTSLNKGGRFSARHGDYGSVFRFKTDKLNEYFLIENRSATGLDTHLPSSGLAVYHCDTLGSNEHQGGSDSKHYQCALIQADGHKDLEHNLNYGDEGDLFGATAGVAAAHDTLPHTREWDGTDSGLVLRDIGAPGRDIKFVVELST